MEEIVEGLLRFGGSIVRHLLYEIIFQFVLFNLGRTFLLVVTFGQYPRGMWLKKHETRISIIGVLIVVVAWLVIAYNNNAFNN